MFQFDQVHSSTDNRRPIGSTADLKNRFQLIMIANVDGRDEVIGSVTNIGNETEVMVSLKDDTIRRVYRRGYSMEQNIGSALVYMGAIQDEQDVSAYDLCMELAKYHGFDQYKLLVVGGGSQWPEVRNIKVR